MDKSAAALLLDADSGKAKGYGEMNHAQRIAPLYCHVAGAASGVRPAAQFLALDRVRAVTVAAGDNHGLAERQAQMQQPIHELRHHQAFARVAASEFAFLEVSGIFGPIDFAHGWLS